MGSKESVHWTARRFRVYAYDPRHQLTSAVESGAGAYAGSYSFGVGGRFATASVAGAALPGSEVKNRKVTYHYASGVDKEAVSKLTVGHSSTFWTWFLTSLGIPTE